MEKDNIKKVDIKPAFAEKSKILTSKQDKEIFFNTPQGNEEAPNEALLSAIRSYNELKKKG